MSYEETTPGMLNPTDTEYFLETLLGPEWESSPLVFQTFDDNRDRKKVGKDAYAKVLTGTWREKQAILTTLNRNGAGIYLTVNETHGGRRIEHLRSVRAIWCEWDNPSPPPEWPLAPHILVESSPNKFHIYWLVEEMTPGDHYRVMTVIARQWGGDPNAIDVTRVLRLPGFYHQKVDSKKQLTGTPFLVRVIAAEARDVLPPYHTPQLLTGFRVREWESSQGATKEEPSTETKSRRQFVTQINLTELKDALKHLSSENRETWLKIGMALASTNHSAAFALWDEWSRVSDKYDEEDQYRTWQSFREQSGKDHDNPVTLGTLYKLARDKGWSREAGWQSKLSTNAQGKPVAAPSNISLILRFTPAYKDLLRFDTFRHRVEYAESKYDEYGRSLPCHTWSDTDDGRLSDYLLSEHGMTVTHLTHCTQAVENVAHDAEYDPITHWLDSLPAWDGIDRLESFFEDFCEVQKSAYASACGKSLFLSLVARAYEPGCQVDTVLVLQGPEGARKTSLCRLLGGPWYKAITLSFESKDLYTALRHCWLGELAELDSFARSGQARIKALITTMEDNYRPAYARNEVNQPRRTVFIGTTNDPAYLVDPHGARRFLPLPVKTINIEGVADALPQLYAEARERYKAGESWWEMSPEVEEQAQEARELAREFDPWEHQIAEWINKHPEEIRIDDIMGSLCLDIPVERRTRAFVTRIGTVLYRHGYEKKQVRDNDDWTKRIHVFVPKNTE